MLLTVNNLREEFGLEDECKFLFHNKYCQGVVYVYGTFSGSSVVFKFDNKIDYFEFIVEAKNLIENNIWREIKFGSQDKSSVSRKGVGYEDRTCLEYSIDIEIEEK